MSGLIYDTKGYLTGIGQTNIVQFDISLSFETLDIGKWAVFCYDED